MSSSPIPLVLASCFGVLLLLTASFRLRERRRRGRLAQTTDGLIEYDQLNQQKQRQEDALKGNRTVGFVWEEIFGFHTLGYLAPDTCIEPVQHWETPASKRRILSLMGYTGLLGKLLRLPRVTPATREQIELVHSSRYIDRVIEASERMCGDVLGDSVSISRGGYEIALMSAGM
jgi:hypothetical protein